MNMMRIFYIGLSGVGMMFSSMASGNDAGGLQSPACGVAVSYTHLDVYKRQDHSFVGRVNADPASTRILDCVLDLARKLSISIVAEGEMCIRDRILCMGVSLFACVDAGNGKRHDEQNRE